jgi:GLPGLI family protein
MKKYVTLICAVGCGLALHAQTKQGTIVYEQKIDVHRHMQDEQMKAMVPQFQTANYELVFKDSISVYKTVPKDEAPDPFDGGGGGNRVFIRFGGPGGDGVLYKNFSSATQLQEMSLEDKKYIVTDSVKQQPWKLAEGTQTILNHTCKKATLTTERGSKVVAWYTEDIAMPVGPDRFSGLPGAVLAVDVDSAGIVFTATEIRPTADNKQLKAPNGGKMLTNAEFTKKMDEVMGPADAQGRRMIRREN